MTRRASGQGRTGGDDHSFALADVADDAQIRRLLRDNPVPGAFSLALTREPAFFEGRPIEGPVHQTIVARRGDDPRVIGIGGRSVRTAFVDGAPVHLGYPPSSASTRAPAARAG